MTDTLETFWSAFAAKHRAHTTRVVRALAHRRLSESQFATLLSADYNGMSPSKARQIYRYLREHDALAHPDVGEESNAD